MFDNTALISKTCTRCDEAHKFVVDLARFELWRSGTLHIQDAFPDMAPDHRELLISGICGTCYDELFPEDEEDEYMYWDETNEEEVF